MDAARQKKFGAKKPYPPSGQLIFAQVRFIGAGELAGAWESFGGVGAQ